MNDDKTNDEIFHSIYEKIENRSKIFWRWYQQNCALANISRIVITIVTALLIGDESLRGYTFYPDNLLPIWALIGGILINLEIWWNPWEKRKTFLIKGQRLDSLAIQNKIKYNLCNSNEEKVEIINKMNENFILILRESVNEYKY